MVRAEHEERSIARQDVGNRMRRRGVMAGAAALATALAAREVAEAPAVSATTTDTNFIATSATATNFSANGNTGTTAFGLDTYYGTFFTGVYGQGSQTGVTGTSNTGNGVYGVSYGSHAIFGSLGTTTAGTAGVIGIGNGNGTYGVRGNNTGSGSIGVRGRATGGYAVVGDAAAGDAAALYGSSSSAGAPAFAAYNGVAGGLAGTFNGKVYIVGDFIATGGVKSAAVPHPDGSHRLLYCLEVPESWFEDFGEGTLTGGKADVRLDPDFAAVVDTSTLHVFLTPHDESHHLAVKATSASGFSVAADVGVTAAARGVKAGDLNGTFTWRVVAKRKDVQAPRLAKVDLPKIPAPPPPPPPEPKPKAPDLPRPPKA